MFRFSNAIFFSCVVFGSVLSVFSFPADDGEEGVSLGLPLNTGSTIPGGEPPVKETTVETSMNATNQVPSNTTSQPVNESSATQRPESSSTTNVETTTKDTKSPDITNETGTGGNDTTTTAAPKSSSTRIFATLLLVFLPLLSIKV